MVAVQWDALDPAEQVGEVDLGDTGGAREEADDETRPVDDDGPEKSSSG
jgi:hypothetical protein